MPSRARGGVRSCHAGRERPRVGVCSYRAAPCEVADLAAAARWCRACSLDATA